MTFQSAYGDYPRGCRYKPTKTFAGCVHSSQDARVHLKFSDTEIYVVRCREDLEVKRIVDGGRSAWDLRLTSLSSGVASGIPQNSRPAKKVGVVERPPPRGTWAVLGPRPN
jgi:hypothetical protein